MIFICTTRDVNILLSIGNKNNRTIDNTDAKKDTTSSSLMEMTWFLSMATHFIKIFSMPFALDAKTKGYVEPFVQNAAQKITSSTIAPPVESLPVPNKPVSILINFQKKSMSLRLGSVTFVEQLLTYLVHTST